jgi:hypothetical protein
MEKNSIGPPAVVTMVQLVEQSTNDINYEGLNLVTTGTGWDGERDFLDRNTIGGAVDIIINYLSYVQVFE